MNSFNINIQVEDDSMCDWYDEFLEALLDLAEGK